ncbi:MAG: DUF6152 family protein [Pseudomonadota bacterium]
MQRTFKLIASCAILPSVSYAHHSVPANFDLSTTIEISGVIQSVVWRNPHVRLKVLVNEGTADEQVWEVESHSLSNLRRQSIDDSVLVVGDPVRMAGPPGRRKTNYIFMQNLLLKDGREVIFEAGVAPRYSDVIVGDPDALLGPADNVDADGVPTSIFAVWTTDYGDPGSWPVFSFASEDHPVTPAARAQMAAHDVDQDDPIANCTPKGMPSAMSQPYPIQLIEGDTEILLRIEEYDATRTIHLQAEHDPGDRPADPLGYSSGRWEGDSLIVTTTNIDFGFFNVLAAPKPVPQSPDVHVVETFRLRQGGGFLDYTMTVTDPTTHTRPMTYNKFWQWRAGAKIEPYVCAAGD